MKQRSTPRTAGATILGLVLILVLAACGSSDDDAPDGNGGNGGNGDDAAAPSPTEAAGDAPAELNDLVVGIPGDTTNVDGDAATVGQGSPNANILEPLLRMTPDYEVVPHLAESFEFVEPNTWRFRLREGVQFHDGSELTAEDVVWTFDRVARTGGRAINAEEGGTVAVDRYTVEYTPSRENLKIPLQVVHPIFGIHKADSDPATSPVGTGPFRFASYAPQESLVVERFEDYWDEANAARSQRVTFRYIPDDDARVLALRAGDVDIITQVPRGTAGDLSGEFNIVTSNVGAYEALSIQINGEGEWDLTAELAVREAIFRAVDREAIVEQIWEGNAEVGRNLIPPAILGDAEGRVEGGPTYDPDGARSVLEDAGWTEGGDGIRERDGRRLELTLINGFPEPGTHRPIPEVLQAQLREVGIGVAIVETTTYDDTLATGEGHLWLERGNQNDANPGFLPTLLYLSLDAGNVAGTDYARAFGVGPDVDEPLLEALGTSDIARTQELAAESMAALIDQHMVILPIAGLYNITATSGDVSGFEPHSALVHTNFASAAKE